MTGKPTMKIEVQCHAGYRGNERPVSFHLGESIIEVTHVLDRWYGPEHAFFKVRGSDGGVYILKYDEAGDEWELNFFKSGCMI